MKGVIDLSFSLYQGEGVGVQCLKIIVSVQLLYRNPDQLCNIKSSRNYFKADEQRISSTERDSERIQLKFAHAQQLGTFLATGNMTVPHDSAGFSEGVFALP